MYNFTLESIFNKETIERHTTEFAKGKNTCGNDGVNSKDIKAYLDNHPNIWEEIFNDQFIPSIVTVRKIPSKSGKLRNIYLLNSIDKFIMKILAEYLSEKLDELFDNNCLAYRKNYSTANTVDIISDAIKNNCKFVLKLDIENFYDTVNHNILINKLNNLFKDLRISNLIIRNLKPYTDNGNNIYKLSRGIVQGNPISPLLSNIYMADYDKYLNKITRHNYRYSDDVCLFFDTYEQAFGFYNSIIEYTKNTLCLSINQKKSGIYDLFSQKYLGYIVVYNENSKEYNVIKDNRRIKAYNNWNTSGLTQTLGNVEIIENGILTVKDSVLVFENDYIKDYLPPKSINNINIYSDVNITGRLLEYLNENKISLSIFNEYGSKIGRFVPNRYINDSRTFIKQVKIYNNNTERLALAQKFAIGEMNNIKSSLMYYQKHTKSTLIKNTIAKIKIISEKMKSAKSINGLMLLEAEGREMYYSCFNEILPRDDFEYTSRSKRPPKDALNALISFGNTILYNYIANEIYKTSLDIKVGYLHSTTKRAETLNLDIAEIFKPIIIDRCIFSVINKRMINERTDFNYEKNKVYINSNGKRIFLKEYYKKMNSNVTINETRTNYKQLIWHEIMAVRNYIVNDTPYKPFKYHI